ncbi:hypothetical protein [Winogradskyella sp.]|uniref:hypothetical protein n=1 Tax=Winogradskyella sp. TaxID=1883156 RepID=UPI00260DE005|nr:hypothetical protein [Winogradskyella sp.]
MTPVLKSLISIVFLITALGSIAQTITLEKGSHNFGIGLNGGIVIGDFEDSYSGNIGVDLFYLYGFSKRFYAGASTGFANYFFDESAMLSGIQVETDDLQFMPIAVSFRVSPFKNFFGGTDIGYAIGINDSNDGGFYISPRATYFIKKRIPIFLGYRNISLDSNSLSSIQFGIGYTF